MKCVLYLDYPENEFAECIFDDCDRTACRYHPRYDIDEEKSDSDFPPTKDTIIDKFIDRMNGWQFFLFMLLLVSLPFIIGFIIYSISMKILEIQQSRFLILVFMFVFWYLIFAKKYRREMIDGYPELNGGKINGV